MKNMRIHSLLTLLALTISVSMLAAPKRVTLNEFFCEPVNYLVGCQVVNTAGQHEVQVTEDSTVVLNIQFGVPTTHIYAGIDKGEKFLFGCNSYSSAGDYPDTLTSAGGCDSVVVLHLSNLWCDTVRVNLTQNVCQTEIPLTYYGYRFKRYVINNDTTILDTVPGGAASGCDSIATITFNVYRVKLISDLEEYTLCPGQSKQWRGKECTEAKIYRDTVRYVASGCDSAYYSMKLSFYPEAKSEKTQVICGDDLPLEYDRYIIYRDTIVIDTLPSRFGCDSIVTTKFVTRPVVQDTILDTTLCYGDFFVWFGEIVDQAKTYTTTLKYAGTSCDSVRRQLNLRYNHKAATYAKDTAICPGTNFLWRDKYICSEAKMYRDTVRYFASGCDSVYYTMDVKFIAVPKVSLTKIFCESDLPADFTFPGSKTITIFNDTVVSDTVPSARGCDSITTIRFRVNRLVVDDVEDMTICTGTSIQWHGQTCDEEKTYYATVPYAGMPDCDSAHYQLNLSFYPIVEVAFEKILCENELPYTYRGAQKYVITDDEVIVDKVAGGSMYGCDSIATITFKINRVVERVAQDTIICQGDNFTWRDKFVCSEAKTYRDTVRYAATGCDSAIYSMKVRFHNVLYGTVADTLCLSDARAKAAYAKFNIQTSGTYFDTLVSVVTGCDSIQRYDITILSQPQVPDLNYLDKQLLTVVCGQSLNIQKLEKAVQEAIDRADDAVTADVQSFRLEVLMDEDEQFDKIANQQVPSTSEYIQIRVVVTTECGENVFGLPARFKVERPSPENMPELGDLPAVSKYNNWLLMLHLNQVKEIMGYEPQAEDVTWYQVQGDLDPVNNITNDVKVGTGYYYTADKSLPGSYYAVVSESQDACRAQRRTIVLTCEPAKKMTLAPQSIRQGQSMTLSNINPDFPTTIDIYNLEGRMIDNMSANGMESYQINPTQDAGIYLMRVENGDQEQTFKFNITK